MMKKIVMFALMIVMSLSLAHADAAEGQVKIAAEYSVPQGTPFPFILTAQGNGTVYDGTESIRNGSVQYEMVEGQEKQLRIVPDAGYLVTHIYSQTTSEADLKDQLEGDQLTVTIPNGRMILTVVFEKEPVGDKENAGSGDQTTIKKTTSVFKAGQTGDNVPVYGYLLCAGLSGMILLVLSRRKRHISQM